MVMRRGIEFRHLDNPPVGSLMPEAERSSPDEEYLPWDSDNDWPDELESADE